MQELSIIGGLTFIAVDTFRIDREFSQYFTG